MLSVLVLTMMCLTACASGANQLVAEPIVISPSQDFLFHLANEYYTGVYGEYTREVVKDWIAQNKPLSQP